MLSVPISGFVFDFELVEMLLMKLHCLLQNLAAANTYSQLSETVEKLLTAKVRCESLMHLLILPFVLSVC